MYVTCYVKEATISNLKYMKQFYLISEHSNRQQVIITITIRIIIIIITITITD